MFEYEQVWNKNWAGVVLRTSTRPTLNFLLLSARLYGHSH